MLDVPQKIGMAPFFHSNIPLINHISNKKESIIVLTRPAKWDEDICLFILPEHLRKKWWNLANENLQSESNKKPNFTTFFDELNAFSVFKGIPILPKHRFEVLVRLPGESYKQKNTSKKVILNSVINLGDEQTHVVIGHEKILLEPGYGLWVSEVYTIKLSDTLDKSDLDVLLLIER